MDTPTGTLAKPLVPLHSGFSQLKTKHASAAMVSLALSQPVKTTVQRYQLARRGRGMPVTAFSLPVVPRGEDRIHTRMSAADDLEEPGRPTTAFAEVGRELGVIA